MDATLFALMAQEIVEAGRFLYAQGWSPATSSNYSARIDEEHVAITVSGKHKGRLSVTDVMVVDVLGNAMEAHRRSSAETLLHTELYRNVPEVGAVLHTHSVNATVLSRLWPREKPLCFADYELQKAFSGVETHEGVVEIPIFENTQDIEELAGRAWDYLKDHPECPGYLIRGHGLYTWAESMDACLRHVEAFEFLLRCELEIMRINAS